MVQGIAAAQSERPSGAARSRKQKLLARSLAVAMRARALGEAMKIRSGLKEGVDVTMRNRKPVDPLEVHDWMAQGEVIPLNSALAELWTRDDQEGIRLANDVVNKCAELLGVSTARQPASDGLAVSETNGGGRAVDTGNDRGDRAGRARACSSAEEVR